MVRWPAFVVEIYNAVELSGAVRGFGRDLTRIRCGPLFDIAMNLKAHCRFLALSIVSRRACQQPSDDYMCTTGATC